MPRCEEESEASAMNGQDSRKTAQSSTPSVNARHERQPPNDMFLKIAAQDNEPIHALKSLVTASRDLLRRTAELPDTEGALLRVLAEYRYAVFAFAAVVDTLPSQ